MYILGRDAVRTTSKVQRTSTCKHYMSSAHIFFLDEGTEFAMQGKTKCGAPKDSYPV